MPTRLRRRMSNCWTIPQLENPGEVRDEPLLPSFLYLPGPVPIFRPAPSPLPWDEERGYVVGRLAQKRGVENAGRLVSSAKSLALAFRSGPDVATAALPRAGRSRKDLARGSQPAVPGAPAAGVGYEDARRAVPVAAGTGDRPGILRRRGTRTHPRGRPNRPAIRTSRCSKNRRQPSMPGSSGIPTGASASNSAISF